MNPAPDYHVVTADGRVLYTTPHLDMARREAATRARLGEDVEVREVVTTITSRRVYRPRAPREQAVAA